MPESVPAPAPSARPPHAPIRSLPPGPPKEVERSAPVGLSIPAIGVRTSLVRLGLNPDGTLQVPTDFSVAGWYKAGTRPGPAGCRGDRRARGLQAGSGNLLPPGGGRY